MRAMTIQKIRATIEAPTQISRRLRTFSTTEMAGIWIQLGKRRDCRKQPDYRIGRAQLEAECNKEDPAGQRDHGLRGEPVLYDK